VYGLPTAITNSHEGPAYGVALLAAVGTGAYRTVAEACDATIKVIDQNTPQARAKRTYDELHPVYQQLYRSLKTDFATLAGFVTAHS
jgi:xylulokinase